MSFCSFRVWAIGDNNKIYYSTGLQGNIHTVTYFGFLSAQDSKLLNYNYVGRTIWDTYISFIASGTVVNWQFPHIPGVW